MGRKSKFDEVTNWLILVAFEILVSFIAVGFMLGGIILLTLGFWSKIVGILFILIGLIFAALFFAGFKSYLKSGRI